MLHHTGSTNNGSKVSSQEKVVIGIVYPLLAFVSNSIWTSTTSITTPLLDYYNITSTVVGRFPNLVFSVLFLILGPTSAWVTRRIGILWTLFLSSAVMTAGCFFSSLAANGFFWLMLGSSLVAVTQPYIFSNTSTVALMVVGAGNQGMYIGSASVVGSVGTAWGFAVSIWLISDATDYGHYFPSIELLYLAMSGTCTAALLVVVLRRRAAGRLAGSTSGSGSVIGGAGTEGEHVTQSGAAASDVPAAESLHSMHRQMMPPVENKYKIATSVLIAAILGGMSNAVTVVLEQVMEQEDGRSDYDVFVAGALYLIPSIPTAFAFGYWMDITSHETAVVAGVYISTALLQVVVLTSGISLPLLYTALTVYGATTNVLSTVCLPSSNRWANGNHAKLINTTLSYLNNLFSFVLTVLFSVVSVQVSTALNWALTAFSLAGAIALCFMRTA